MPRSARPPQIRGVSEEREPTSLSGMLMSLAGGERGSAQDDVRSAIRNLQSAAERDPRLGPKLSRIIEDILGMDDESDSAESRAHSSGAITSGGVIKTPT